jgi:hypothetical protein
MITRNQAVMADATLVLSAAAILSMICATAPLLNVTLNEGGTDIVAVDLSGVAISKAAIAAEQR